MKMNVAKDTVPKDIKQGELRKGRNFAAKKTANPSDQ
jgi:hypothetical protein